MIGSLFGQTAFLIEGQTAAIQGNWNELGRQEEIVLSGRRVFYQCTAEATCAQFATPPVQGKLVTRIADGAVFRIVGHVNTDGLTFKFALDSRNR